MAILPWRFQADLIVDEGGTKTVNTDPDVTVFVGATYTNDITGVQEIAHDTGNPMIMKLSELPAFIAASAGGIAKDQLPKRQGIDTPAQQTEKDKK